jgi:hypothetical protein
MGTFGPESYDGELNMTTLIFEVIFGISVLLKFNLEYKVEESPLPVRDYGKIADRYIKTTFIIDILPLIPFP